MNVLVYDSPFSIARFVRSVLRGQGHRVSISDELADARSKLGTMLFDAMVIGPTGAPRELADFLEREFPGLPVLLAGVEVAVPGAGQVAAVLPAPLSARTIASLFARLDQQRRKMIRQLPAQLAVEGLAISCTLADLTVETMSLAGESDEFQRYFQSSPRRVNALVSGIPIGGEITAIESDVPRHVRQVDVRLEGAHAREILVALIK